MRYEDRYNSFDDDTHAFYDLRDDFDRPRKKDRGKRRERWADLQFEGRRSQRRRHGTVSRQRRRQSERYFLLT